MKEMNIYQPFVFNEGLEKNQKSNMEPEWDGVDMEDYLFTF